MEGWVIFMVALLSLLALHQLILGLARLGKRKGARASV